MSQYLTLSAPAVNTRCGDAPSVQSVKKRGFSWLKGAVLAVLFSSVLVARPNQAQSPEWQWAAQSTGSGIGQLKSLAVDAEGNAYQVGFFTETIQFGNTTLVSQGWSDVFVAKLSAAGSWDWAVAVGSAGSDNFVRLVPRFGLPNQRLGLPPQGGRA